MKASSIKYGDRFRIRNDTGLGIQTYGKNNDYPQICKEITSASGTASSCLNIYAKFIYGRGFTDSVFYKTVVNRKGQTNDDILSLISRDYADYGGFALHVNFDIRLKIIELQHVPFEMLRFEKIDRDTNSFSKVAVHPDWGRRFPELKRFRKEDIKFYDLFNSDTEFTSTQIENSGGIENYNGQIFYYSSDGYKTYPKPIYDAVLSDMGTEEGVSTVKYRNVRSNFLPAGMIIDKRNKSQDKPQAADLKQSVKDLLTDENACNIVFVEVNDESEIPEFKPFKGNNYDQEFTYTEDSVQQNIGRIFGQPPVLRAEDVSGGFGADLITNAYNFYNSITSTERLNIETVFAKIFKNWKINFTDFSIKPLSYDIQLNSYTKIPDSLLNVLTVNERRSLAGFEELKDNIDDKTILAEKIGVVGLQSLVQIVTDEKLTVDQKAGFLQVLYGLSQDQTDTVLDQNNNNR